MSNADQEEFWSGAAGAAWVAQQDAMDAALEPVLNAVLDAAALKPRQRVLDIGCGAGASTLQAAHQVGPDGSVLGADISQTLVSHAETRLADVPHASVITADAATVALPGPFDEMISRFGVMFFDDTAAAFRNIAASLAPGAQLTMAAWADARQNPYFMAPAAAARQVLGDLPKGDRRLPGPFAFEEADRVRAMLSEAGLSDIAFDTQQMMLTPKGDVNAVADLCMVIGPAASAVDKKEATPDQRDAVKDAVRLELSRFETPEGIRIPALIHIITARA